MSAPQRMKPLGGDRGRSRLPGDLLATLQAAQGRSKRLVGAGIMTEAAQLRLNAAPPAPIAQDSPLLARAPEVGGALSSGSTREGARDTKTPTTLSPLRRPSTRRTHGPQPRRGTETRNGRRPVGQALDPLRFGPTSRPLQAAPLPRAASGREYRSQVRRVARAPSSPPRHTCGPTRRPPGTPTGRTRSSICYACTGRGGGLGAGFRRAGGRRGRRYTTRHQRRPPSLRKRPRLSAHHNGGHDAGSLPGGTSTAQALVKDSAKEPAPALAADTTPAPKEATATPLSARRQRRHTSKRRPSGLRPPLLIRASATAPTTTQTAAGRLVPAGPVSPTPATPGRWAQHLLPFRRRTGTITPAPIAAARRRTPSSRRRARV